MLLVYITTETPFGGQATLSSFFKKFENDIFKFSKIVKKLLDIDNMHSNNPTKFELQTLIILG